MSFIIILLIFTFGTGIRNVTPTPGGIGGIEAGLVGGFVAYGITDTRALAAVMLYRLVSYWFPMIIGAIALIFAEQKRWFRVPA